MLCFVSNSPAKHPSNHLWSGVACFLISHFVFQIWRHGGAHLCPIRISGNRKIQASFNFDEKISLIEGCQGPKLMPPYRSSTIPLPDPPKPFCHQITLRVLFWDMSNLSLLDFASRALLARPWFKHHLSLIYRPSQIQSLPTTTDHL